MATTGSSSSLSRQLAAARAQAGVPSSGAFDRAINRLGWVDRYRHALRACMADGRINKNAITPPDQCAYTFLNQIDRHPSNPSGRAPAAVTAV